MNALRTLLSNANGAPDSTRTLLASRAHTVIFFLICLGVSSVSLLNAGSVVPHEAHRDARQPLSLYISLIGLEWLWLRFIYKGMERRRRSIREFLGARALDPRALASDLVYAALTLGLILAGTAGLAALHPEPSDAANPLLPTLPSGALGVGIWVALSLSAGICEEIVFRGYLQRQLTALGGRLGLAIVLQAIIFGVAHAYEGAAAVANIVLHGLILGLLAAWRGNIRAGIYEHVAWDLCAGLGIIA